jgi:hypothetical protein
MYVDVWSHRITFGKYDGVHLQSPVIRNSYLRWMLRDVDLTDEERSSVTAELRRREPARERQERSNKTDSPSARIPAGVTCDVVTKLISAGRQTLAKRLHPDVGGDTEQMKRYNIAADWLEQQAREFFGQQGGAAR